MAIMMVVLAGTFSAMSQAMKAEELTRLITNMNATLRSTMDLVVRDFLQIGQGLPDARRIGVPNGTGALAIRRPGPAAAEAAPCPGVPADFPRRRLRIPAVTVGPGLGPRVNRRELHRRRSPCSPPTAPSTACPCARSPPTARASRAAVGTADRQAASTSTTAAATTSASATSSCCRGRPEHAHVRDRGERAGAADHLRGWRPVPPQPVRSGRHRPADAGNGRDDQPDHPRRGEPTAPGSTAPCTPRWPSTGRARSG